LSRRSIAIFGGPGSGAIAAQTLAARAASGDDVVFAGYLNDQLTPGSLVSGAPVLGPFASWRNLPDDVVFLAPLHKAKEMQARAGLIVALGIPEHRWATVIDPRSAVAPDAVIGHGCFVGPFATVGPAAQIGRHSVVRAGAHISHDCLVGDFAFVGTNAVVCGYAALEDGAFVAPNATIRERCRVGRFSLVGLGSMVLADVSNAAVVAGSPARPVGPLAT
jgi:sugar O-acyltransferase (sialic acid O-acetyltransferase NeuD family)